jgi:hypothetical protein
VACKKFYRPKRNGILLEEAQPQLGYVKEYEENGWWPYKLYAGDLWECPQCYNQIIVGVPNQPITEHFKENYLQIRATQDGDLYRVNDC